MKSEYNRNYNITETEWKDLKNKHEGLWQIFNLMIECGYASEYKLKKEGALIRNALSLIPSVDGSIDSEFSDLFAEALSDFKSEVAEYRTAREGLEAEYQAKIQDVPEREKQVRKRELQASKYEDFLEAKRIKLNNYEAQLELKKKELELYEKKLNEIESPELRDRVRLKNEFLATVERFEDQWTNKAIVWSIGAILSGTQVPSFKGISNG